MVQFYTIVLLFSWLFLSTHNISVDKDRRELRGNWAEWNIILDYKS